MPALKSMNLKFLNNWVNIKKDEDKGYDVGFERVIYSLLQQIHLFKKSKFFTNWIFFNV